MKKIFKIIALVITLATTPLLAGPGGTPEHVMKKLQKQKQLLLQKL